MKNFIFIIAFLFSNTAFAAPSYDATVKWLVDKIPVASNYKYRVSDKDPVEGNRRYTISYKSELQVNEKSFIFIDENIDDGVKFNTISKFKIKDLLSVKVLSNCPNFQKSHKVCEVILSTKSRAIYRKSKVYDSDDRSTENREKYIDYFRIVSINSDLAIRIGKAFQHLIDITDSSEPF